MPKLKDTDILQGSFDYNEQLKFFVGTVARIRGTELMVCTVGIERTDREILDWIKRTVGLMRQVGHTDIQAEDMVDRERVAAEVRLH